MIDRDVAKVIFLPRKTTVIQTIFAVELDHQPLLQIVRCLPHDLRITILKDMVTSDFDLAVSRLSTHRRLTPKVDEFPPKVAFVLRHIGVQR